MGALSYSFCHRLHDGAGGVDSGLGGIDGGHDVGSGGGVQTKGACDSGNFPRGEHEPKAQEGLLPEHQQSRHQDGGLEEGGQAEADDLLDPLDKAVGVPAGDAEHIQSAHGDLYQEDAASLEIGKKDLNYRIGHKQNAKQEHDRTGNGPEAEGCGSAGEVRQALHLAQVTQDQFPNGPDARGRTRQAGGKGPLQRDGQGVEGNGNCGEQTHSQKSLECAERGLLDIPVSGDVFDAKVERAYDQADDKQRPAQLGEKQHNGLNPAQLEQFNPHIPHLGKEIAEKAHSLAVHPVIQRKFIIFLLPSMLSSFSF